MRSLLIALAVGATALLLSGCPDTSSHATHAAHDGAARALHASSTRDGAMHHGVSEIAWFQGTIDEAFSRRGCPESRPRRTLFRF